MLDDLSVKGATCSSVCLLYSCQLWLEHRIPELLWNRASLHKSDEGIDNDVPQLLMMLMKEEDEAGRLRIQRARNVQDSGIDKLLNP